MRAPPDIDQRDEDQIKGLPRAARLRLLARIADDLATMDADDEPLVRLLDREGLGAEVWQGVDVRTSLDAERSSWERP